jgi:uncharacterized protein (DUF58 family)
MTAAILRRGWQHALQVAERRLPALTRYRRAEPLPIALHRRRIYILPTSFGLLLGSMLVVMLLGALNFGNNAALLLTFALAGAVQISVPRTVRHLEKLELLAARAAPVHAGQDCVVQFHFRIVDGRARWRLQLASGERNVRFDLAGDSGVAELVEPTTRRGWQAVGRHTLSTSYPFGLFRAWSVLHPEQRILVYARAEAAAPPLPRGVANDSAVARASRGDDWHGLREYRAGDSMRLVAWKASARQDRLLVREFDEPRGDELVLDWHALAGLDGEARIARLTRWVLDASARNLAFSLHLPHIRLGPARGQEHSAACLRELALLP